MTQARIRQGVRAAEKVCCLVMRRLPPQLQARLPKCSQNQTRLCASPPGKDSLKHVSFTADTLISIAIGHACRTYKQYSVRCPFQSTGVRFSTLVHLKTEQFLLDNEHGERVPLLENEQRSRGAARWSACYSQSVRRHVKPLQPDVHDEPAASINRQTSHASAMTSPARRMLSMLSIATRRHTL